MLLSREPRAHFRRIRAFPGRLSPSFLHVSEAKRESTRSRALGAPGEAERQRASALSRVGGAGCRHGSTSSTNHEAGPFFFECASFSIESNQINHRESVRANSIGTQQQQYEVKVNPFFDLSTPLSPRVPPCRFIVRIYMHLSALLPMEDPVCMYVCELTGTDCQIYDAAVVCVSTTNCCCTQQSYASCHSH